MVKANALRRLASAGLTPYRLFLLMGLVEAYMPLDGPGLEQYRDLLVTKEYQPVIKAEKTTFEFGQEQGLALGREQGRELGRGEALRAMLSRMLTRKFGPLPDLAQRRLQEWPAERLEEIGDRLIDATSLAELGLADG